MSDGDGDRRARGLLQAVRRRLLRGVDYLRCRCIEILLAASPGIAGRIRGQVDRLSDEHWYDFPLGREPWADAETYLDLAREAAELETPEVDRFEEEMGFSIDRKWLDDLALISQIAIKRSTLCYAHGRVLYAAARRRARDLSGERPVAMHLVETGTARGFSALTMAKALADSGVEGSITTFDLLPHDVPMYWNCVRDQEGPMSRQQLLADYAALTSRYLTFLRGESTAMLRAWHRDRVHLAFLDAAHTYEAVRAEMEAIAARQMADDVIVFDDYSDAAFPGVVAAADEGCRRHGYDRKAIASVAGRRYLVATRR